jgi:hypothetical protein
MKNAPQRLNVSFAGFQFPSDKLSENDVSMRKVFWADGKRTNAPPPDFETD